MPKDVLELIYLLLIFSLHFLIIIEFVGISTALIAGSSKNILINNEPQKLCEKRVLSAVICTLVQFFTILIAGAGCTEGMYYFLYYMALPFNLLLIIIAFSLAAAVESKKKTI